MIMELANVSGMTSLLKSIGKVAETLQETGELKIDKSTMTKLKLIQSKGSMLRFMSNTIIEPVVTVSKDLKLEDKTEDIINTLIEIFTAYYTQTFHIITSLYGLDPNTTFDLLSSKTVPTKVMTSESRDVEAVNAIIGSTCSFLPISDDTKSYISMENENTPDKMYLDKYEVYKSKVLKYESTLEIYDKHIKATKKEMDKAEKESGITSTDYLALKESLNAMETKKRNYKIDTGSYLEKERERLEGVKNDLRKGEFKKSTMSTTVKQTKQSDLNYTSLIQKEVNITLNITKGTGQTYSILIPVFIKASIVYTNFDNILNLMSVNDRNKSFSSRLDEYRSGAISLSDFVFAGDLIKSYKSKKLKDKDDLIKFMNKRSMDGNAQLLRNGAFGFSSYYSMFVITKAQSKTIENKIGGKLVKPRYNEMFFEQTKSMIMAIADSDYERVSIITKDLNGVTDISYRQLSKSSKADSGDKYAAIFKDIIMGRTPNY